MSPSIKVAVIGAGFIGRVHMKFLSQNSIFELVGAYDPQKDCLAEALNPYGGKQGFDSIESLMGNEQVDAVVVATPNDSHAALAIQALQSGKHVLLEKPMATNGAQAQSIVDAQRKSGKHVMLGHQMRWEWPAREVKRQIDAGRLGCIYNAKAGYIRLKGIPGWGSWFTRKECSGGGPLIDIGVHMLDLTLWLMGNPKPVSVVGSTYAKFGPKKEGLGDWGTPQWDGLYDVEDLASAHIKMDNGSTLTLDVSWAAHTGMEEERFVHLMGDRGGASIVGDQLKCIARNFEAASSIKTSPPEEQPHPRSLMVDHFARCILEDKKPLCDVQSGLINNRIIDAIYQSSKSSKAVELNWEESNP